MESLSTRFRPCCQLRRRIVPQLRKWSGPLLGNASAVGPSGHQLSADLHRLAWPRKLRDSSMAFVVGSVPCHVREVERCSVSGPLSQSRKSRLVRSHRSGRGAYYSIMTLKERDFTGMFAFFCLSIGGLPVHRWIWGCPLGRPQCPCPVYRNPNT